MSTTPATQPQQRTVALSAIHAVEGFNPRDEFERAELDRLAQSIRQHGVITPLVVAPDGDGAYRLIDGERRYRAAGEAAVVEVPVIVRAADGDSQDLEVALVANMSRVDLDVVQEAKGFRRLIDSGLTRKGVAEKLGVSQKLVRDRLALLDLDEALQPGLADGTIPPGAVKPLLELAKVNAGLPGVALRRVAEQPDDPNTWGSRLTWSDVARDPIGFVAGGHVDDGIVLPDGLFEAHTPYPLERFSLDEKTSRQFAEYCELVGIEEASQVTLSFGHQDVETAEKLGAAHRSTDYAVLIAGQAVADQLAADQIARTLKAEKARRKDAEQGTAGDGPAPGGAQTPTGGGEAVDEHAAADQRRRQREAEKEDRRRAIAFNDELGAAVVKHLTRVKVDARVVKILSAIDFGGDLDKLAMRGARYGFPGFESSEELKSGKTKRTYLQAGPAHNQATAFLQNAANNPADVAGRLVALAVMARYADENAVAQSARSFSQVSGGGALPWSYDTVLLIDEIAAERLPDHLLEPGREQREAEAERRREVLEDRAWLAEQLETLDGIDSAGRAAVLLEVKQRFGDYATQVWQLRDRIEALDAADQAPEPAGGEGDDA